MLQRTVIVVALSGSILFACGCQGKPAEDDASIQKSLHEKSTARLMDEVAKAPDYHPPADGHLADWQVKMYFEVRQREQKIREVAFKSFQEKGAFVDALKRVGDQPDIADVATAGLRAAQELGYNPKEYQWVKERVLEAQMQETARALSQQIAEGRQQVLALFERRRQEASDPVEKAEIERQIAELGRNAGSTPPATTDPARELNAQLLARYKDDLARLQAEDQRISQELQSRPVEGGESPSGGR
jgi:hypothetical protein